MTDTTKAIVRTFFFLVGAYILYTTFTSKPAPDEKYFLILVGGILLASARFARIIGIAMILVGLVLCGLEYFQLSRPWIGINPDLGGYVWGLGMMIIGGIFLAFAPSR